MSLRSPAFGSASFRRPLRGGEAGELRRVEGCALCVRAVRAPAGVRFIGEAPMPPRGCSREW